MAESVATSIVFVLDNNLSVYQITTEGFVQELLFTVEPENRRLQLSEKFEPLWNQYWGSYFAQAEELYLLVGPQAGFTDGRIVHNWLKSTVLFYPDRQYFVDVIDAASPEFVSENMGMLLTDAELRGNQELVYSREPRIGRK
jgi:hypothetical protein